MKPSKLFRNDIRQTRSLVDAGITSAKNAIRQSKALDLPVTYIKNDVIYVEDKFGVKQQGIIVRKEQPKNLIKGMILRAKQ